jgi:large subunit ribosomal protein L25
MSRKSPLNKLLDAPAISATRLSKSTVNGKAERTLPKDVEFHPVSDRPIHVDFLRLAKDASVHVNVPVSLHRTKKHRPGLKRGGVLNIVRHELELICDAAKIPDEIVIDVTGFDVGDSIHISHVKLPEGSKSAITDRDFTIATVVAPSSLKSSEGDTTKAEGE